MVYGKNTGDDSVNVMVSLYKIIVEVGKCLKSTEFQPLLQH